MTQPIVLPLDSPDATLALAGGKGVNLARLARAGLPAPGGFIVTTAAYSRFIAANSLQAAIRDALAAADPDDPAALEAASQAIRGRFTAAAIPADLAAAILANYELRIAGPVAVRSSATAEDLPDMSFAGQQDTFLNVAGEGALLDAVRDCWSSLWTARAIAYRARNGIPHDGVALSVVVQAMVQSEASGVLFTANPLTGRRSETVIDATLGLGEALVGGHVEPDSYVVDTAAGRILERRLGAKAQVIRSKAGGGTVMVDEDGAGRQALPDAAILDLARLGKRVEQELYAGQPQDIEWAWAGGELTLLQSRAITSLYPLPAGASADPLLVLFSGNHVQGMLDPLTPLGQDVLCELYAALASVFGRRFQADTQREVLIAGERLYLNITPMVRHPLGRKLAGGILSAIEPGTRQALAPLLDDPRLAPGDGRLSRQAVARLLRVLLPVLARAFLAARRPDRQRDRVVALIDGKLAAMRARSRQTASLAGRLALMQELFRTLPTVAPHLFPPLGLGMGSFYQLRRLASNQLGDDQLALAAARGLPHNVTTEMDLVLWTVAQVIRADRESAERFAAADAGDLAGDYLAGRLPVPAQAAIAAFMDRYGMRGLAEIDIGRPRWRERPAHVMQVVQSYLRIDDPEQAPDAVFRRGAVSAEAAIARLVAAMDNPVKAWQARFFAGRMRALAGLRETPKFSIIRMMGIAREMLLASGEDLAAAGVLAGAEDVFYLHLAELQELAAGARRDWQDLAARRRQVYQRELLRRQIPRIMLSDGLAIYEGLDAAADGVDGALSGSPVSPGLVEGVVRVVFDPHETQLAPGEILVCPGTDPSWTPLFLAAGGLVMEVGGLMTHGSVVAREYGIPAVVGVDRATERLHTGQRVRVDGSAGRITLLG